MGLLDRFAGENLIKAFKAGAPTWGDVAINAFPSLLYGGSLLTQGANPMEAGGTALSDLGIQMVADTALGTIGSRLGMKFADQRYKDLAMAGKRRGDMKVMQNAQQWGNIAKMGSMATMMFPNPVANSFYERLQKEQTAPQNMTMATPTERGNQLSDPYSQQLMSQLDPTGQAYASALMSGMV